VYEIIKKNFKRVVIGMPDPNPLVAGKSIEKLRFAGIEVEVGILEQLSREINKAFAKWIQMQEPYISLKIGQSIDGNIALKNGVSQWITSRESRSKVQYLRSEVDAILIGRNTAMMDNPHLTVREIELPTPKRIVLDSHLSLPLTLNLFTDDYRSKTYVVCDETIVNTVKAEYLIEQDVQLLPVKLSYKNKIDLKQLIKKLGTELSITSVLVEGGSQLFSNFLKEKLVDELHFFIAPKIIGDGLRTFSVLHTEKMDDAINFQIKSIEKIGSDIYFSAIL
jgi:diaminohydroxyphosphoribosylaminopyrimidine deaminase/5-amino-6-(5-phosphoribosylamino)uracil reductase